MKSDPYKTALVQKRARLRELFDKFGRSTASLDRETKTATQAYIAALAGACGNPEFSDKSPAWIAEHVREIAISAAIAIEEMNSGLARETLGFMYEHFDDCFPEETAPPANGSIHEN